jgi:predicted TIM-barrel fold metal-dependent hydrolase
MTQVSTVDVLFQPAEGTCSSPESALAAMDAAGVAVAFLAPCTKLTCERQWACVDTRLEDVAKFLRASIRFAGLCGFNPFDSAESLREMHAARALGFRGVYVHLDSFGLPLGDARFYPLFATASELEVPAVVQCPANEASLGRVLRRIGRDFPELSLALALPHPQPEVLEAAGDFERLSFALDTATVASLSRSHAELFADWRFSERCMWGSNGAALQAGMAEVSALPLSPATLSAILRDNALRIFATTSPARNPRALDDSITAAER